MLSLLQRLARVAEPLVSRRALGSGPLREGGAAAASSSSSSRSVAADNADRALLDAGAAAGSAVQVQGLAPQPQPDDTSILPVLLGRTRLIAGQGEGEQPPRSELGEDEAAPRPPPILLGRTRGAIESRPSPAALGGRASAPAPVAAEVVATSQAPPLPVLLGRRQVHPPARVVARQPSAASMRAAARSVRDSVLALRASHWLERRTAFRV